MLNHHGRFVWYELITTDIAAAKAFYTKVVGWNICDASTPDLDYTLFTMGSASVGGLMNLPEEARKMGATPRWVGYVAVEDIDLTADGIGRRGGTVYVPPTNSNIGRIAIVADPQGATLALVKRLKPSQQALPELGEPGRVGWHELFAVDWKKAFVFYNEFFGWREAETEGGPMEAYQMFNAGETTIGGMLTKRTNVPFPFWLYYFNVGDIDVATEGVKASGGEVSQGPIEVPGGNWIARCVDPQGAMFALQGTRSLQAIERAPATEIGWSTEWEGFSSKGRLVAGPRR